MTTYYLLPRTNIFLYKHLDYIESVIPCSPLISDSLSTYLYEIKEKMDFHVENGTGIAQPFYYKKSKENDWDIYKKYTNPYEYIDTIIPFMKNAVSKQKHLSRSYYKMIEMIYTFNLHSQLSNHSVTSFHLAEGPGGFIEAFAEIRQCSQDVYIGMTILDDKNDPNIPAWKKSDSFLKRNPNVFIEAGADKTGDILSFENFTFCVEKYGSTMEFITADGGFDFSMDFNNQEYNICKLLFAQISFAICMQKENGSFVLKIFDSFMPYTVDILSILASFYEKVYITKPQTSRYANSEKYIICKGFLFPDNTLFYSFFSKTFLKMKENTNSGQFLHRWIDISLPIYFLSKVEEYNAIFGQQQIENIHYTLSLIDSNVKQDKINQMIKLNIQKCIQWCIKYNIEYHPMLITNHFYGGSSQLRTSPSFSTPSVTIALVE
jgi:23S rRNA U2552 (ribose-2'-O)-methylase RlmE/FtsJ